MMYKLIVLSVFISTVIADQNNVFLRLEGRIVGGEDVSILDAPYQVLLRSMNEVLCGGSIISEDLVLTAAHCVDDEPIHNMTVRAGSSNAIKGGSTHKILEVYMHENYSVNYFGVPSNDIAILRVSTPFKFDDTRQPIIPFSDDSQINAGTSAIVTGWGSVSANGPSSQRLKKITIPILSKSLCTIAYHNWGGLPSGQICTRPTKGKDSCQGDSGGPLVIDGTLAGIVSWNKGCANLGMPGVYTEVAYYRQWIQGFLDKRNEVISTNEI